MVRNLHAVILFFSILSISGSQVSGQTKDTIRSMSYNLLNFPNGRNDCGTNIVIPARWDTLAIIMDYAKPDILMVCELQNEAGADSILNRALNINGQTAYARADFIFNQSAFPNNLNNMLFYNSNKLGLYKQEIVLTHLRDISKYTLYVKDPSLAMTQDTTFLDVYVGHLDASAADSLSRKRGCDSLRAAVDTNSLPRNALFGGDFNFYFSSESGYQTLLSGVHPFIDPINSPGNWTNTGIFAPIHTQSTRAAFTTAMDCGATGGMDDRFDFILASDPVMSGIQRIRYLPGTYRALGNNGSTFNKSINDPTNTTAIPFAVKHALYHASDHLPIMMDLEIEYTQSLPLALLAFEGEASDKSNRMQWKFENSDVENVYFELEASSDGINFVNIANKTSDEVLIHLYVYDEKPSAQTMYYHLKWQSQNAEGISNTIAIENPIIKKMPSIEIMPNPVSDQTLITLSVFLTEEAFIQIYDMLGHLVYHKQMPAQSNQETLNLSDLPGGAYTLLLKSTKVTLTKRLLK